MAEKITDTGRKVLRSLLPLEGVTICFTGKMNMPVDTHKGIAEALGAKVSGSVHSNTSLVVFGPDARSKLDKAIEHNLPRMSESGWMWMAALLGYGKPENVSPYGKFHTGGIDGLDSDLESAVEVAFKRGAEDWVRMKYPAQFARLVAAKLGNESESRISDSEKPKGGLSGIPTIREIHDQVLAEVEDWRSKNGPGSMPSTYSIARAFHRMLTDDKPKSNTGDDPDLRSAIVTVLRDNDSVRNIGGMADEILKAIDTGAGERVITEMLKGKEPAQLVEPEGWYLAECRHEHTAHRFAGQTVTPSDHLGGSWYVDFQRLHNGGMLTGGRGYSLTEAWQNAVNAIRLL
ncbi:BRCT domain-containing protein [Rhizobium nepotum]|uniref:BRCT domain-containing protein n=1 Tax=Rhizobium nepotum TaxID=1035271 RepID=UPI003CF53213